MFKVPEEFQTSMKFPGTGHTSVTPREILLLVRVVVFYTVEGLPGVDSPTPCGVWGK